jgi:hypothetical protein
VACGLNQLDVAVIHACSTRSAADSTLETIHALGVPFDDDLDAAVGQVPHEAGEPFDARLFKREPAEADALHAAADQEPARDHHRKLRMIA